MPVNILSVNNDYSCSTIIRQLQCPGKILEHDDNSTNIVDFIEYDQSQEIEWLDFYDTQHRGERTVNFPHLTRQIIKFREPVQLVFWCEFVFCEPSTKPQTFPFSSSTFSINERAYDKYDLVSRRFTGLVCRESLFLLGDLDEHEIKLGFMPKYCVNFKFRYRYHLTWRNQDPEFFLFSGILIVRNQQDLAMNICSMGEKATPSHQHHMFYLTHPLDPIRPIFLLNENETILQEMPQSFEYLQSFQDIVVMLDITISALRFFQFQLHEKISSQPHHRQPIEEESKESVGNIISPNYKPSKSLSLESVSRIPTRSPLLDHHAKTKIASPSPKYSRFKQSQSFLIGGNHQPSLPTDVLIPPRWQSIVLKPISVSIDVDHAFTYDPLYCHERPVNIEFSREKDGSLRRSVLLLIGKDQLVRHIYLNIN